MQHLTPVGLDEDGTALVLTSTTGTRYAVPIATLRAALPESSDEGAAPVSNLRPIQPARPGEKTMDSVLRPRDIQTRIRAGESPEAVAAAAGTTVEKIMGFAAPVLAERQYVAEQAQKASVRRRAGEGPAAHLGEAVEQRLRSVHVDPASAEWDAWRREDRRWTLVVDYRGQDGPQRAEFVYDAAGRYVIAENDESRWLVGERSASSSARGTRPSRSAGPDDEQLPLGDDAIEVVTGRRPVDAPLQLQFPSDEAHTGADESLTEDLTEIRTVGRPAGTADADWISTQASDRPASSPRPVRAVEPAPPEPEPAAGSGAAESGEADSAAAESAADDSEQKSRRRGKSKGRASVPSWDEIMFGSNRSD